MRALAHPVRIAVLELIHEHGTANATECAREVGGTPQSCSYHLRALAKWGLIRKAESDDGRETRWETAAKAVRFSSGERGSPGYTAAAAALKTTVLARDERVVSEFLARERELPPEWREAATLSSGFLQLTAEELEELNRRISEATKEFTGRTARDRPEGARRVDVMFRAIPKVGD
jgi:DNA-binding transcriptional ArsR family regulator